MLKIEKIIKQIEDLFEELKKEVGIVAGTKSIKNMSNESGEYFSGLTGEIFNLVTEGFFDNAKSLSDIQSKLKDGGIKRPTTALMKPMILLIRKKVLDRSKPEKGTYQYFKRLK